MAFKASPNYSVDLVEKFLDSVISAQEFFGDIAQHDLHSRRLLYALYKERNRSIFPVAKTRATMYLVRKIQS